MYVEIEVLARVSICSHIKTQQLTIFHIMNIKKPKRNSFSHKTTLFLNIFFQKVIIIISLSFISHLIEVGHKILTFISNSKMKFL